MSKKALLMILDGWGFGNQGKGDVIFNTPTPYWDYLMSTYPHSQLQASGENVGLPDGQMGNSEVGHTNIGAGRVVYQMLVKISKDIETTTKRIDEKIEEQLDAVGEDLGNMFMLADNGVADKNEMLSATLHIALEYRMPFYEKLSAALLFSNRFNELYPYNQISLIQLVLHSYHNRYIYL